MLNKTVFVFVFLQTADTNFLVFLNTKPRRLSTHNDCIVYIYRTRNDNSSAFTLSHLYVAAAAVVKI